MCKILPLNQGESAPLRTRAILAQVALRSTTCFATFDNLLAATVGTVDRDECHGVLLAVGRYQDEVQCDIIRSPSPLLEHYLVENTASGVLHHHKHVEQAKSGGDHHAEVTRDDGLGMIAHKGLPVLGGRAFPSTRVHTLWRVLPDRPRRDPQAQLQ